MTIIKISIKKASEMLGVSISTLRRWEEEGKIISERTSRSHKTKKIKEQFKYIFQI